MFLSSSQVGRFTLYASPPSRLRAVIITGMRCVVFFYSSSDATGAHSCRHRAGFHRFDGSSGTCNDNDIKSWVVNWIPPAIDPPWFIGAADSYGEACDSVCNRNDLSECDSDMRNDLSQSQKVIDAWPACKTNPCEIHYVLAAAATLPVECPPGYRLVTDQEQCNKAAAQVSSSPGLSQTNSGCYQSSGTALPVCVGCKPINSPATVGSRSKELGGAGLRGGGTAMHRRRRADVPTQHTAARTIQAPVSTSSNSRSYDARRRRSSAPNPSPECYHTQDDSHFLTRRRASFSGTPPVPESHRLCALNYEEDFKPLCGCRTTICDVPNPETPSYVDSPGAFPNGRVLLHNARWEIASGVTCPEDELPFALWLPLRDPTHVGNWQQHRLECARKCLDYVSAGADWKGVAQEATSYSSDKRPLDSSGGYWSGMELDGVNPQCRGFVYPTRLHSGQGYCGLSLKGFSRDLLEVCSGPSLKTSGSLTSVSVTQYDRAALGDAIIGLFDMYTLLEKNYKGPWEGHTFHGERDIATVRVEDSLNGDQEDVGKPVSGGGRDLASVPAVFNLPWQYRKAATPYHVENVATGYEYMFDADIRTHYQSSGNSQFRLFVDFHESALIFMVRMEVTSGVIIPQPIRPTFGYTKKSPRTRY